MILPVETRAQHVVFPMRMKYQDGFKGKSSSTRSVKREAQNKYEEEEEEEWSILIMRNWPKNIINIILGNHYAK